MLLRFYARVYDALFHPNGLVHTLLGDGFVMGYAIWGIRVLVVVLILLMLICLVSFAVQAAVQTIAGAVPGALFSAVIGFSYGTAKGVSDLAAELKRGFQDLGGPKLVAVCQNGIGWTKNAMVPSAAAAVSTAYWWLLGLQANATLEKKRTSELALKDMFRYAQVVTRVVTEISNDEENVKRELIPLLMSDNQQDRLQASSILEVFQFLPNLAAQGRLISGDAFWKTPLEDALKTQRLEISGFRQRISTLRVHMTTQSAREIKWWHWWKTRHSTEASRIGKALQGTLKKSEKTMATIQDDLLDHLMPKFSSGLLQLCDTKLRAGLFMSSHSSGETYRTAARKTGFEDDQICHSESIHTTFNPLGRVLVRASMACDVGNQVSPHIKSLKKRLSHHVESFTKLLREVGVVQKRHSGTKSSHGQTIDQLALLERQLNSWEVLVEAWYSE